MRIISFVHNNSGPCYHRLIMPLMLMDNVDVFITNNLLEEHFEQGCDIFMYNRVLPESSDKIIAELKKKYGFKICVDIDDWWELDPHHVLYDLYQKERFADLQVRHLREADFVFTTNDRLFIEVEKINPNVYILPNAIPHKGQFDVKKTPSNLTRLFWQGSVTHGEDMALLRRPIESLGDIAGKIKMIMSGYTEGEPEWYSMVMDYTANLKHQYKLIPGCHVNEYYKGYQEADICLIPLINSPFNRMKSSLKVLEAANLGLPVICSDVHPYKDLPVLYAKGTGEWIKQIKRLVASKKRQKEAGEELREYCQKNYDFFKINKERKQVLEYESKTVNA